MAKCTLNRGRNERESDKSETHGLKRRKEEEEGKEKHLAAIGSRKRRESEGILCLARQGASPLRRYSLAIVLTRAN